jgi:GrpB-like predicted nucleotidyltransferase (UPF0157 family)
MSTVHLLDYQPEWPSHFMTASAELFEALAHARPRIEHIGSTAVSGLCAKPVVDILLGVCDLADVESRIDALAALGYRYRPEYEAEIPQRRYFVRPEGVLPRIHVHAVLLDSSLWSEHIAFRDVLRSRPELAAEYGALKRALAARFANDKAAYTEAKAPFIANVLAIEVK